MKKLVLSAMLVVTATLAVPAPAHAFPEFSGFFAAVAKVTIPDLKILIHR